MNRVFMMLAVSSLVLSLLVGCEEGEPESEADEQEEVADEEEEEAAAGAFEEYQLSAMASEAQSITQTMADGARFYFESDQLNVPEGHASEPWHVVGADDDMMPGMPVRFDNKVFPGGPDIRIVSAPEVPKEGEQISFEPEIEGDAQFDADAVMASLGVDLRDDVYFRYTYETGPGTGDDATAKIIAEANFDPSTPEHHTVVQEVSVHESDGAVAFEPTVSNEYK